MFSVLKLALVGLALALGVGPAAGQTGDRFFVEESDAPIGDVLDAAAAAGQFDYFLAAVRTAGLESVLRAEGPITVFAPTDEAFRQLGEREIARLMRPANRRELSAVLTYHVVAAELTAEDLAGRQVRVEAANGFDLTIDARDGLRINDHLAVLQDVPGANGTLHGVNTVLRPPILVASR